jgi:alpha-glucosidase
VTWQDSPVQWWRDAVFYQVYLPSFTDSDGDGVGDLDGLRSRLGYLELLGVDALWLGPVAASGGVDGGYDVTDPRAVDPTHGDLDAFDTAVTDAHAHGLRVIVNVVPNHTSAAHDWFRAALASPPGSPERARYHFRPGRGPDGAQPPDDWRSVFGGPAWTRAADGEWYLHLFSPAQPDLNWDNLEVWADLDKTLRFWLDRGVDGVRIDVAHGMCKAPADPEGRFDHEAVHDVHRLIRATLDDYPGRVLMGAVAVGDPDRFARYLRADELHLGLDVALPTVPFDADAVRAAVEGCLAATSAVGAPATWALADHDVPRPVTRFGGGATGRARARAMALVALALPGAVQIYNGDELGLPDGDPVDGGRRDTVHEAGRDGCRVPLPWDDSLPAHGFTDGEPWLPVPSGYGPLSVAVQLEDTTSTLSLYRRALELRRTRAGFGAGEPEWFGAPPGCLAFRRAGSTLVCALNTSAVAVPLPPGDVLLTSGPLSNDLLPPDTAAWLV